MKDCYYYFAVAPIKNRYLDYNNKKPLVKIPVKTKTKECNLCFYGSRKKSEISFIKITIPNCKDDKINDEDINLIQALKEHALSVLRIIYDRNISFYPITFWTFHNPKQKKYKIGLLFREENIRSEIDEKRINNVFCATFDKREDFKLFSDSMDNNIPTQYRYLSLYKIIENNFKNAKGKLDTKKLDKFLKPFGQKELRSKIVGMRNKCAHIKDKKGVMGVTQLNRKQLIEAGKLIHLLQSVIIVLLNEKGEGKFNIGKRK